MSQKKRKKKKKSKTLNWKRKNKHNPNTHIVMVLWLFVALEKTLFSMWEQPKFRGGAIYIDGALPNFENFLYIYIYIYKSLTSNMFESIFLNPLCSN